MIPRKSTVRFYRIRPEEIHYLTFIIEAYEGLAVVSTIDRKAGIIKLEISPGQEDIIDLLIEHEGSALNMVQIFPKSMETREASSKK